MSIDLSIKHINTLEAGELVGRVTWALKAASKSRPLSHLHDTYVLPYHWVHSCNAVENSTLKKTVKLRHLICIFVSTQYTRGYVFLHFAKHDLAQCDHGVCSVFMYPTAYQLNIVPVQSHVNLDGWKLYQVRRRSNTNWRLEAICFEKFVHLLDLSATLMTNSVNHHPCKPLAPCIPFRAYAIIDNRRRILYKF